MLPACPKPCSQLISVDGASAELSLAVVGDSPSKLKRAIRQHRRLADRAALALAAVESDETRARCRELLEFHCRRAIMLSARLVGAVR